MGVKVNRGAFAQFQEAVQYLKLTADDVNQAIEYEIGLFHRQQVRRAFLTAGASTPGGRWKPLSPWYQIRKRGLVSKSILGFAGLLSGATDAGSPLVLTGDTIGRFTNPRSPHYVQRYVAFGKTRGTIQLGAVSDVAMAHATGNPEVAPNQSPLAAKIFPGMAKSLPIRDVVKKTRAQVRELRDALVDWYLFVKLPAFGTGIYDAIFGKRSRIYNRIIAGRDPITGERS